MKCPKCQSDTNADVSENECEGTEQLEVNVSCCSHKCRWAAYTFLTLADLTEEEHSRI